MRPGRELDTWVAKEVFGHAVKVKQKELWEVTPLGERPLKKFSRELSAAWEVAEKLNISLIPVGENQWFAMVGGHKRFESPADFLKFLQSGKFADSGAAVGSNIAETICLSAVQAFSKRTPENVTSIDEAAGRGLTLKSSNGPSLEEQH